MFKSFKSRVLIGITSIVMVSIIITITFLGLNTRNALIDSLEENALNIIESTKLSIESQYNSIIHYRDDMLERRQIELKNNTLIVFSIIDSYYNSFSEGTISEDEAKSKVIEALKTLRYDDGIGYFWINNIKRPFPEMIMHPTIPELDGEILDNEEFNVTKDTNENLFKTFVDVVLAYGEGYVEYLWPKPTTSGLTEQQPKLSFVKFFEPWEWVVGTGLYIDDIEASEKQRIDVAIADLNDLLSKQRIGESGYFFIFDENKNILVHPNLAGTNGSNLINLDTKQPLLEDLISVAFKKNNFLEYRWNKPSDTNQYIYKKKTHITYFEPLNWYIASSYYEEDFKLVVRDSTLQLMSYSIVFLIIAVIGTIMLIRSLLKPLNDMIEYIRNSDDELPSPIQLDTHTKEITLLKDTINNMIQSIYVSREAFNKKHKELQNILDSATLVSIISTNPNGIIEIFNTGSEKMLGYSSEELVNNKTPVIFHLKEEVDDYSKTLSAKYNEDIEGLNVFIKTALEEDYEEKEWTYIKKNGEHLRVNLGVTAIRDNNDEITGFLGVATDITQRTNAENRLIEKSEDLANAVKHLKEQEEHLEELVFERTSDLEASLIALKEAQKKLVETEKMAALGGLVAGVAHEINTPVGIGVTLASNIEEKTQKIASKFKENKMQKSEFESYLNIIEESSHLIAISMSHAAKLIDNFKSIATNQTVKVKRAFNICEYINEIAKSFSSTFEHSNISVEINCKDDLVIFSYSNSFYQIMTNLIMNSLIHGFDLKESGQIRIDIETIESTLVILYEDNGNGIVKEEISKIFDPFYTTRRGDGGTGLGLNIIYNLVSQNLNGTIESESEYGKFTRFIIKIPLETKK